MQDNSKPLPKFGDWDVNNPASGESFTEIFNKARDERKGSSTPEPTGKNYQTTKSELDTKKSSSVWCCCLQGSSAEY